MLQANARISARDFADKSWLIGASRRGLPHDIATRIAFWLVMLCIAIDWERTLP